MKTRDYIRSINKVLDEANVPPKDRWNMRKQQVITGSLIDKWLLEEYRGSLEVNIGLGYPDVKTTDGWITVEEYDWIIETPEGLIVRPEDK